MTRADLLAEIVALPGGSVRQLLVTGDAGMGKSTVLDEAAKQMAASGSTVLRASPAFAERYTAYSALWDLVAPLEGDAIARVHPEYQSIVDMATGRRPVTADVPALATALALEGILADLADSAPVVLIIDDVQWADQESRAAVERAFRRSADRPVYLLAASRTIAGGPAVGADLGFDIVDERNLEGLSVDELDGAIRPRWPSALTRSQVIALREHTGGNPLWALELVSRESFADLGARAVGTMSVPVSLSGAITLRLRSLSDDAREVVSILSLLGQPSLGLLSSVLEFTGSDPQSVAQAEEAGFITLTTTSARTLHPLYASAATALVAPARRRDLHRFIADAVADPVIRAQHLQLSRPAGPDEEIAIALAAAADVMHQRGARLRSAHFAAQAVNRTDPSSGHYPSRLLTQAQHLFSAGDLTACLASLPVIAVGDLTHHQFDAYLALSTSAIVSTRGRDASYAFLRRLEEEFRIDAVRLALVHAHTLADDMMTATTRGSLASVLYAALAGIDAPNAVHRALRGSIRARLDAGSGLDIALIEESTRRQGVQIVAGLDDTGLAATGYFAHIIDDVAGSRAAIAQLVTWARDEGKDGIEKVFLCHAALVELTGDDMLTARLHFSASGFTAVSHYLPASVLPIVGLMLLAEGKYEEVLRFVDTWQDADVGSGLFAAVVAPALRGLVAVLRNDWPSAVEHLRCAADAADSLELVELGSRFRLDAPLIEALFNTGEVEEARTRLNSMRTFLRTRVRPIAQIQLHILTSVELGALRRLDEALVEADVAAHLSNAAGRPGDEATSLLQRAKILIRLRKVTLSRQDVIIAGDRAAESGRVDIINAVAAFRAKSRKARSNVDLTAAEERVKAAILSGRTNREIAGELFIGVRTVESHVSAILRKTGVASRSKLRPHQ